MDSYRYYVLKNSNQFVSESLSPATDPKKALVLKVLSTEMLPPQIGFGNEKGSTYKDLFTTLEVCTGSCNEKFGKCNGSTCECIPGYFGATCNDTCQPLCVNGTCNSNTKKCDCSPGWKGVDCNTKVPSYKGLYIALGVIAALLLIGGYFYFSAKKQDEYTKTIAENMEKFKTHKFFPNFNRNTAKRRSRKQQSNKTYQQTNRSPKGKSTKEKKD